MLRDAVAHPSIVRDFSSLFDTLRHLSVDHCSRRIISMLFLQIKCIFKNYLCVNKSVCDSIQASSDKINPIAPLVQSNCRAQVFLHQRNRRVGIMVRASASQLVVLGSVRLAVVVLGSVPLHV